MTGINTVIMAQSVSPAIAVANNGNKGELTSEERAAKSANYAEKKLGLTTQQKNDWQVIALKRDMVNRPLHDQLKGATTPEERKVIHSQIKDNNKAFEESVNFMLTPEQKPKFIAMKEERKQAKVKGMKKKFEEVDQEYGE